MTKLKPCHFTPEQVKRIMDLDMLEGWNDFNGRILRDKIVQSRKPAKCMHCGIEIKPGSFVRAATIVDYDDDEILSAKLCQDCCTALAKYPVSEEPDEYLERMDKFRE